MPAIDIENLSLSFGTRDILTHFNASMEDGEFIGIFGPNGAGKSTLLRAILGLLKPTSGSIKVLGEPARCGHTQIGYVPQSLRNVHTNQLNGRARLMAFYHGYQWGLPILSHQQKQEIDHVLETVGAQHYADRPFAKLSGGEQQRLLLAQALLNHPKILLLDEPLASLDIHHQNALIQLIQQIQQQSKVTVLFTAHDLNPLIDIMDRIIYLAHGKAAIGTVEEVVTDEKLSWLYDTPIEVVRYHQRLFVISQEQGRITGDVTHCHPPFGDI